MKFKQVPVEQTTEDKFYFIAKGKEMTFHEACTRLGITEYEERIMKSNSRGELFHLMDYILFATKVPDEALPTFKLLFTTCVKMAEEEWERPESVFQHMPSVIDQLAEAIVEEGGIL